jgi:hypothetical protein
VRGLKVFTVSMLVVAFAASAAFAGGPSCSASKNVAAEKEGCCLSTVFAGAGNHCTASKEKLAELVDVETVRLPSGALVVMYKGKTPEAVSYLQTACTGSACNFCCPVTRTVAANQQAHVEIAKIDQGAMIVVTAKDKKVVDQAQESYMTLASAATTK